jgi:hypothetical protein
MLSRKSNTVKDLLDHMRLPAVIRLLVCWREFGTEGIHDEILNAEFIKVRSNMR